MLKYGTFLLILMGQAQLASSDTYIQFARKSADETAVSQLLSKHSSQARKNTKSIVSTSTSWQLADFSRIPKLIEMSEPVKVVPRLFPVEVALAEISKNPNSAVDSGTPKKSSPDVLEPVIKRNLPANSFGVEKTYRPGSHLVALKPVADILPGPVSMAKHRIPELKLPVQQGNGLGSDKLPLVSSYYVREPASISINDSRDQAFKTLAAENLASLGYVVEERFPFQRTQLNLQFIDDRSSVKDKKIYPAAGLKVFVIGTGIVTETDTSGIVSLADVPLDSHLQLKVEDPNGEFVPSLYEVNTFGASEKSVKRLYAFRDFAVSNWMNMVGVVPDASKAALCGSFHFAKGAKLFLSLEGTKASGPFYFNSFGFMDPRQPNLSDDGRFCYFNMEPGTYAVSLKDSGNLQTYTIATGEALGGLLSTLDKPLVRGTSGVLKMGVTPPAVEQLSSNTRIPLLRDSRLDGNFEPMGLLDGLNTVDGEYLEFRNAVPSHETRINFFNHSSEYDDSFYSVEHTDLLDDRNTLSLLPRGFSEDLARYANQVYDPARGNIYLLDGGFSDVNSAKTYHELFNTDGQLVAKSWQFAWKPLIKSFFFNIPAGQYSLVAKQGNQVLQMTTVMVFEGHTSVVNLGAKIQIRQ